MLEYRLIKHPDRVWFGVELDDPRILEHLQFAHLINMKFDGSVQADTLRVDGNQACWTVVFEIDANKAAADAIDWCDTHIEDGQVLDSYLGALDRADPQAWLAKQKLGEFKALTTP